MIRKVPWTTQPQVFVPPLPEWNAVYNPGIGRGDATGRGLQMAPLPAGGIRGGSVGKSFRFATTDVSTTTGAIVPGITGDKLTMVMVCEFFATTGCNNFLFAECPASTAATYNYGFYEQLSGNLLFFVHNGTTAVNVSSAYAASAVRGPQVLVATYDGAEIWVYVAGIRRNTSAAQTGNVRRNSAGHLSLMRWNPNGVNMNFYAGAVMNRCMTKEEIFQKFRTPETTWEAIYGTRILLPVLSTVSSSTPATSVFDGKIIIKSSGTNLLDGKVQVKDVVTALLDGKVAIGSVQQSLLDGKLQVKDVAISYLDGKVMVKNIATSLLDGLLEITQGGVGSDLLDGKIQIKDALTALVDGKVIVKSVATDLLDGKLSIGTMAINLLDGKLQIKDIATALLDGKIRVKSATVDLVDGKIIIADGITSFSSNNQLLIDSVGGKVLQLGNTRINTWNTAGRPASPKTGTIGFNTQTVALDIYDGAAWKSVTLS